MTLDSTPRTSICCANHALLAASIPTLSDTEEVAHRPTAVVMVVDGAGVAKHALLTSEQVILLRDTLTAMVEPLRQLEARYAALVSRDPEIGWE